MEKIKVVQYGCGKMSVYTMRYVFEKGARVVGAFDIDPKKIGLDIGEIIGDKKTYRVKVQNAKELEKFLTENAVDVVIVETMSLLADVADALLICAKCGVNAITTCEEAFFPQNSNPKLFKKINDLATANGCTICGSGYQDVFWGNLISVLAGATHKITKIRGKSSYNVEDYGIALARAHGAGLSEKQFDQQVAAADRISDAERKKVINAGNYAPSYMWNVNGWLCSKLGLTVKSQTQRCVPQIAKKPIVSKTLGMTIPKGSCTGMSAVVTTTTKEGVVLETECIGKVYDSTEFDCNDWTIEGEPSTRVVIERPATVELTCATIVNRLPEVLMAPAGYFTTEYMPENFYKNESLENYLFDMDCDCGCEHDHTAQEIATKSKQEKKAEKADKKAETKAEKKAEAKAATKEVKAKDKKEAKQEKKADKNVKETKKEEKTAQKPEKTAKKDVKTAKTTKSDKKADKKTDKKVDKKAEKKTEKQAKKRQQKIRNFSKTSV